MLLRTTALLTLALSAATTVTALPAAADQLQLGGQAALNWGAGALSRIGDDGTARTNTKWSYLDCGTPDDVIQIESIALKPDPPQPGHNLTIYGSGTTKSLISDGTYADVVVKLGLIKLLSKRFDVCEELGNANATLQCPIEPDHYNIVQTVDLPAEIPPAKYVIRADVFTQDDAPAACIQLTIDFLNR
ncbi:hypothetical protein T439DRAFT_301792 [Meredithblackwellia eburnea MCA 4105]